MRTEFGVVWFEGDGYLLEVVGGEVLDDGSPAPEYGLRMRPGVVTRLVSCDPQAALFPLPLPIH